VLDASVNISMEPFRAFVGDLLPPRQRKVGFAMQSLLIGLGAVTASMMPTILVDWLGVAGGSPDLVLTTAAGSERAIDLDTAIPAAVHVSFYIGSALFLATVLYTILTTPERPPADLEAFRRMQSSSGGVGGVFREIAHGIVSMPRTMRQLAWVQFFTWFALFCLWIYFVPGIGKQVYDGEPLGDDLAAAKARDETTARRYLAAAKAALLEARATAGLAAEGEPLRLSTSEYLARVRALTTGAGLADDLTPMERRNPLYTTATALLLQGDATPDAAAAQLGDRLDRATRYEAGTRAGGDYFAIYNGVAFGFAFILLALVRVCRARSIHVVCLALGGAGLVLAGLARTPLPLNLAMVLLGVAWASILSMPYAMLANAIPAEKMGFFMGVFNFFIVLPQILASAGLGWVVQHFLGGNGMAVVVLGGGSMLLAAGLTLRVRTDDVALPAAPLEPVATTN
jgi:maltose/moltooligosaccharide transporter